MQHSHKEEAHESIQKRLNLVTILLNTIDCFAKLVMPVPTGALCLSTMQRSLDPLHMTSHSQEAPSIHEAKRRQIIGRLLFFVR